MKYHGLPPTFFPFGKFKLKSIARAVSEDLAYCTWCLTLAKVRQRHPEFVTALRRAVAEAQVRVAESEDAARAAARAAHLSDLLG